MYAVPKSNDPALLAYVEERIRQVERFFGRVLDAHVVVRKEAGRGKAGTVAEIRILIPGTVVFVREVGQTVEGSIERAVQALKNQLINYRKRRSARRRKSGRVG